MKTGPIQLECDIKLTLLIVVSLFIAACQPHSPQRQQPAGPLTVTALPRGEEGARSSSRTSDSVVIGVTTASALQQNLGEPIRVERDQIFYSNCTYQIQQERVQMASCRPSGPEVRLQYWRQLWKNIPLDYSPLEGRLYRLSASQLHLAVIYDSEADRVIQVVRHAR
jgi:hypothetical protein